MIDDIVVVLMSSRLRPRFKSQVGRRIVEPPRLTLEHYDRPWQSSQPHQDPLLCNPPWLFAKIGCGGNAAEIQGKIPSLKPSRLRRVQRFVQLQAKNMLDTHESDETSELRH
jgi:hypothetical protein